MLTLASLVLLPAALIILPPVLLAYAILDEILWLGAALSASGLIVREREALTWSLIRVAPISSLEIAAGKLTGLFYQVWDGVGYLVGARWLGTLLAVPLLALMLTLPHPYPFLLGWPGGATALGLSGAYLLFVFRPSVNVTSGGALGLALSTLTSSTGGALIMATLIGGGLSLSFGGMVWWSLRAFDAGRLFSESILAGRLQAIFYWLLPLGAVTLARLLATPLLLGLATWRVSRLPE